MTDKEMKIVRRKLEMYQDLLQLAAEKDVEAMSLQLAYEAEAGAHAIRLDPKIGCGGGSGRSRESRLNEILSDLQEVECMAAKYRSEADRIKEFIDGIDDPRKKFLVAAYLEGKQYREIAKDNECTFTNVSMTITRCLMDVSSGDAADYYLL